MALITAPTIPLAEIRWDIDRPAQINTSWSGIRTPDDPLYGKWFAKVTTAFVTGEDNFAPIRSFFMRCDGCVNSFHLRATIEAQNANSGVTLSAAAAAGDTSVSLSGAVSLTDGQMVTIADQLLQLTADQSGATIEFQPPLRAAAASGTSVETSEPYALVRLADPTVEWTVEAPDRFSAQFSVEEVVSA